MADRAMHVGASWYPEIWPETEWPKDLGRMREIGFSMVRVFEFAWHRFEPEEGRLDLDWACRVLDLCHAHGIQAMIGTPTAAPPVWVSERYPEILRVHADGKQATHGKRCHRSQHSSKFRALAGRIVEALAKAFGRHPALHSWQIDNEMSGFDHGPETVEHFRAWLRCRYGTIEALNRAWALELWSQAYQDFRQVPLPGEANDGHHPSLAIAAARFQNLAWTEYIAEQCAIIRRHSDRPISTNMVGMVGMMDWFAHNRALDHVGASMYSDRRYYYLNFVRFDRMRAEKDYRPYWLMETAPNWSGGDRTWNIHFDERGPGCFGWLSALLGGSMLLFWQWREHWAGQEMMHGTCVSATGKWRPNRDAWQTLAEGYRRCGPWLDAHPPQRARLALMMSSEAAWSFQREPTDEDMDYGKRVNEHCYLPIQEAQLWRDVIGPEADLAPYRVLCLPLMPMVPAGLRRRLADWVMAGGTLVLGPMTGWRSEEFSIFQDREYGGLEDLIGGESALRFTVQWVEDRVEVVFADGASTHTKTMCEGWQLTTAEVLARYRGGYGDGLPAVLGNRHGAGTVITLGCIVDKPTWKRLVLEACAAQGIRPLVEADGRVVVAPRADAEGRIAGYGLVNVSDQPQAVRMPVGGHDLLGEHDLAASFELAPYQAVLVATDKPI